MKAPRKLAICTRLYRPVLGGSVIWTERMAESLSALGWEVRVVTKTQGDGNGPVPVAHVSRLRDAIREVRKAECVLTVEAGLMWMLAALMTNRPCVVTHHGFFRVGNHRPPLVRHVQRALAMLFPQVGVSRVVAQNWSRLAQWIENGYDPLVFYDNGGVRDVDFLFAGRVVPEKGPDLFLDALAALSELGWDGRAVFIGDGSQMVDCQARAAQRGLAARTTFTGAIEAREVAAWMNRAKVFVIPNRWEEPFGLVALEALACGCRLVHTRSGALEEAAGGFGHVVGKEDRDALRDAMKNALRSSWSPVDSADCQQHLSDHTWAAVARRYDEVFRRAMFAGGRAKTASSRDGIL